MAENKMKQVAEMLGVEMYVPFYIKDSKGVLEIYNPYMLRDNFLYDRDDHACSTTLNYLLSGFYEIEQSILTKKEKTYLEGVLRPFKNKVEFIKKDQNNYGECIHFNLKEDYFVLPYFEKDTMYKGMEIDKHYTVEELGLFEDD